ARSLTAAMPTAHSHVWYSRPDPQDRIGTDYDELGRISAEGIAATGARLDGEFYVCGPTAFLTAVRTGLDTLGAASSRVHNETLGALAPTTPGIVPQAARPPHPPDGSAGAGPLVSFVRTGLNVHWA